MKPNDEETYGNDGYFIHSNGQKIGYDWEYRDRYFSNCRLQFDTLGQYERKLSKDCIQIAIQCDSTETGIAVGWHEDWLVEAKENRSLATDFERKEQGNTRYTHKYKIFSYEEVDNFKRMISTAMKLHVYSYEIYDIMSGGEAVQDFVTEKPASEINCLADYIEENVKCEKCGKKLDLQLLNNSTKAYIDSSCLLYIDGLYITFSFSAICSLIYLFFPLNKHSLYEQCGKIDPPHGHVLIHTPAHTISSDPAPVSQNHSLHKPHDPVPFSQSSPAVFRRIPFSADLPQSHPHVPSVLLPPLSHKTPAVLPRIFQQKILHFRCHFSLHFVLHFQSPAE